jgi:hypothetical protein
LAMHVQFDFRSRTGPTVTGENRIGLAAYTCGRSCGALCKVRRRVLLDGRPAELTPRPR